MINSINRSFNLEDKEKICFDLWLELGSIKKVREEFLRRGWINAKSVPPTGVSITRWAWVWALENPDEAFEEVKKLNLNFNKEEWIALLFERAKGYYLITSRKRFYDWIDNQGFQEYRQYYSDVAPRGKSNP